MRELIAQEGLAWAYDVASAAVSQEELGNPVYPPAVRMLERHGISSRGHHARQMTQEDYDAYDLIIGMDRSNLAGMTRIAGGDPQGKFSLLLSWAGRGGSVDDPWYSGDFDAAWRDIDEGCRALLQKTRPDRAHTGQ